MNKKSALDSQSNLKSEQGFSIEAIEDSDIDYILDMCVKLFTEAINQDYSELFFYCYSDFTISKKAVLDGKIIGCYLLGKDPINFSELYNPESLKKYKHRKSIQGVALGILKEYRGLSYGRQLRDSALSLSAYDYMWGYHVKSLNNLNNWLKFGRRLVGETEGCYVTLLDLEEQKNMAA